MNAKIKEYIEKHIKLIDAENFEEFYKIMPENGFPLSRKGELTEVLIKAGIDPADYLRVLPFRYLADTGIESYSIPGNITSIGIAAFTDCVKLKDLIIGNGVERIESIAFQGCSSLTRVDLPDSVTQIDDSVFESCHGLMEVTLGNNLKSIQNEAFRWCESLENIKIPASVTFLGINLFRGCSNLKVIEYSGTLDQWKHIVQHSTLAGSSIEQLKCKDTTVNF